jgi:hypothetical protein
VNEEAFSTAAIVLLTVVVIALIAVLPQWPYSRNWGYRPLGLVSALLVIMVLMLITGVW